MAHNQIARRTGAALIVVSLAALTVGCASDDKLTSLQRDVNALHGRLDVIERKADDAMRTSNAAAANAAASQERSARIFEATQEK